MELDDRDYCLLRQMWDAECKNFISTEERIFFKKVYFTPDKKIRRVRDLINKELLVGDIGTQANGQADFRDINVTEKGKNAWELHFFFS